MEAKGQTAEVMIAEARKAFWVMVGFLAVIWLLQIANWASGYALSYEYGDRPWDPASLPNIVSSPFLHWSWAHIEANSGPLFIFGFLSAYRGVRKFLGVTGLIVLVSGLGAWFTAAPGSVGAGASGVVFGYFGYVLVRGAFDRHLIDIVVGVVMALCFAYQFTGLLPQEGIGWQAHLFGFLAGVLGGWIFRDRRSPGTGPTAPPQSPRDALLKELDDLGL
ncbi:rhomboid family intramembrane serine protease [Nonomuraea zeae]|uniref:Rhomboid family intramembrane serine protease n=1 Tax=Nonomuraea zeae TaxID=1642303 RepID=A0A5S4F5D2_9ACTN|nr:rhomboid family intramembrane serine protease [Nonomuraea zeae]TMR11112.1 rhomboid family intramembrane serine protease [Nonomuraea zeae]